MKPRLFHISEEKILSPFHPIRSTDQWNHERYVWAISEDKIHNYYLPRQCPRICIPSSGLDALEDWVDTESADDKKAIIFVPFSWKDRIEKCNIYLYEFDQLNFKVIDEIAGYYVSKRVEVPISISEINDCPNALKKLNVELLMKDPQSLITIKNKVFELMDDFSIIKWQNL